MLECVIFIVDYKLFIPCRDLNRFIRFSVFARPNVQ